MEHIHQAPGETLDDFLARLAAARRTHPDTLGHPLVTDDMVADVDQTPQQRQRILSYLKHLYPDHDIEIIEEDLTDLTDDDEFEIGPA